MYSFDKIKSKSWLGTNERISTQIFSHQRLKHNNLMSRNSIEVTCLNGGALGSFENQDNPILNRISKIFPNRPGLYMIHCLINDLRYYGQTSNLQSRKSSHQSRLKRQIHSNIQLQIDYNSFGPDNFHYSILHVGDGWIDEKVRKKKELEYILLNQSLTYNIYAGSLKGEKNPFYGKEHIEESKKLMSESSRGIPNILLGKQISIPPSNSQRRGDKRRYVPGNIFPSVAEASRQTGYSRKLIRERLKSDAFPDWKEIKTNS